MIRRSAIVARFFSLLTCGLLVAGCAEGEMIIPGDPGPETKLWLDAGPGKMSPDGGKTPAPKADRGSTPIPWPDSSNNTPSPDSGSIHPPDSQPGNVSGRTFGQKCGGSWGSCKSGLLCVLFNESGKKEGYCTKECSSTMPCPPAPAGAQCAFKLASSGKTICGFLCSAAAPACPPGLTCTYAKQGQYYYCTTDTPAKCGNNKLELAEECDTNQLNNATCKSLGFSGGTLKCTPGCKLDKSGCTGKSTCSNLPPRDCKAGNTACSKLELFSPFSGNGYVVTHGSTYSWLRHDTAMLVKYAAAAVACLMPGAYPIGLGDMSMSNGKTPTNRHPAGTHDYGRDIDIAYYQTGQPNNYLRPVCPHTTGGAEQYHCTGQPNILDLSRTALFVAKLLESSRVRVLGVDGKVGPLLKSEAKNLLSKGLITSAANAAFSSKLAYEVTDTKMGWFRFHHHHMHLSTYTSSYSTPLPPAAQPAWTPAQPMRMPPKVLHIAPARQTLEMRLPQQFLIR